MGIEPATLWTKVQSLVSAPPVLVKELFSDLRYYLTVLLSQLPRLHIAVSTYKLYNDCSIDLGTLKHYGLAFLQLRVSSNCT